MRPARLAWAKPYLGIFKMRLIAGMQYRAAAWAGVATQLFWGGIQLLVFWAFYRSMKPGAQEPMAFGQLADFVWLRQAFLALVMLWAQDNELLEMIAGGNVAYELCRPLSLYSFWFSRMLAYRISRTLLRCLPIFLIALLLPEPWRFHLPPDFFAVSLFVPSLIFASLLVTAISMFVCILTFISLSPYGARLFVGVAAEFLMGALLPIPFMPEALQKALNVLPFRYIADFPFRVYSGNISGDEALIGLGIQVSWTLVLVGLGIWGFKSVQKRLVVQGG
ncbi:ABC transporter permease [Leadbettera azotonutricia]|uniref:Putative membrane protein n=1 Tax=Leadbettera azotonutricia (strain ATCC BAA-888 / DSM 13862 / ZAS-9) TaxID=545695 RepID=F5Y8U1_LEAAZ|nr:ABC transporter permease [Leadbettera azotonutricia]AEF82581.1 putative membrane protein [Leadbettera azotonutricia ZAS-9]